jgi:hypothetical protein
VFFGLVVGEGAAGHVEEALVLLLQLWLVRRTVALGHGAMGSVPLWVCPIRRHKGHAFGSPQPGVVYAAFFHSWKERKEQA